MSKEGQRLNLLRISATLKEAPHSQLRVDNTYTDNMFHIHGDKGIPLRDKVMLRAKLKLIIRLYTICVYTRVTYKFKIWVQNFAKR